MLNVVVQSFIFYLFLQYKKKIFKIFKKNQNPSFFFSLSINVMICRGDMPSGCLPKTMEIPIVVASSTVVAGHDVIKENQ